MECKGCDGDFTREEMKGRGLQYCRSCYDKRSDFFKGRKIALDGLRSMPLEAKIIKTQSIIDETIDEFGLNNVYISYSGGKDSTVLSHIIRKKYPNIIHIFSDTTNEYPETLKHLKWQVAYNDMNLIRVKPRDSNGNAWNFRRVVEEHGYPMFSKRVANAIRTYRRAKSDRTKENSLKYIERNFKKYIMYINENISDKCCDKLKKVPIRKEAKKLGLECVLLGILATESWAREKDWVENGCNVFYKRQDNQSRPLAFWTEKDIYEYIDKYDVKISDLYQKGYDRNGCMFCGFGVHFENTPNRFQRLNETHPKSYKYLIDNFKKILTKCQIDYK